VSKVPVEIDLEKSIIGAILYEGGSIERAIIHLPNPEPFLSGVNKSIYEAFLHLHEKNSPIDMQTTHHVLKKAGHDYLDYMGRCLEDYHSSANIGIHSEMLKELWHRREIFRRINHLKDRCEKDDLVSIQTELMDIASIDIDVGEESHIKDSVEQTAERVINRWDARAEGRPASGISTGIVKLDNLIGGFHRKELLIIASRPGVGKTFTGAHMALRTEDYGAKVGFWSLEMCKEALTERMVANLKELNGEVLRSGEFWYDKDSDTQYTREDYQFKLNTGLRELGKKNIYIYDQSSNIDAVIYSMQRAWRRHGIDVFIIDHLLEIRPNAEIARQPKHDRIGVMVRRIRDFAKATNTSVVLLTQLNRAAEENASEPPRLINLKDSGGIEESADGVLLLHRHESTAPMMNMGLEKNRHGELANLRVKFMPKKSKLEE